MAPLLLFLPLLLEIFLVLRGDPFFVIAYVFLCGIVLYRKDGEVMANQRVVKGDGWRCHLVEFLDSDSCAVVRCRADEDGGFSLSLDVKGAMVWIKLKREEVVMVCAAVSNALTERF